MGKPTTVDGYIASKPLNVQQRLNELRACLRRADPSAEEVLKWGKPAFVNEGILCVYAGFTRHVSLHPTPSVLTALRSELDGFAVSENTIQFPVDQPLAEDLVLKIALRRVFEKNELGVGWK